MNAKLMIWLLAGLTVGLSFFFNPACKILDVSFDQQQLEDQSVNGYPIKAFGGSRTTDRHGAAEQAYSFNGLEEYLEVNNNEAVFTENELTISAWVKTLGSGIGQNLSNPIFVQRDFSAHPELATSLVGFFADYNGRGKVTFILRSSNTVNGSLTLLEYPRFDYGEWHHYVATLDKKNAMKLYLDSELVAEEEFAQPGNLAESIDNVDIGRHYFQGAARSHLNGALDDVQLFDCALTAEEIKAVFERNTTAVGELTQAEKLIKVYPTISDHQITIEKKIEQNVQIEVFNVLGQSVLKQELMDEKEILFVNQLPTATYFIQALDPRSASTQLVKWVKTD